MTFLEILNGFMFTNVPLLALMCNIFLLFTLITAKKDASIWAFMGLLCSFILWTAGAYCMRSQIYLSDAFWWNVSLTGIFLVPYMYFLLVEAYTEQRGTFLRIVFGIGSVLMAVLNGFEVFFVNLSVGENTSNFEVRVWAVIPVAFTLIIFFFIWKTISRTIKDEEIPLAYLNPLFVGVIIMLIGITINVIPKFNSLPTDTLACALNAACIYYAFYKKRFYALSQITSRGSMYVVSLLLTGVAVTIFYEPASKFLQGRLESNVTDVAMVITVICAGTAILLFTGLNKLNDGLFVREQLRREEKVHDFSAAVNPCLKTNEILQKFSELIQEEVLADHIYICMYDEEKEVYTSDLNIQSLEMPLTLRKDHPMVKKLQDTKKGLLYSDFQKTTQYKSMWEKEKLSLSEIHATYLLPFIGNDETLFGMAILSEKRTRKSYTYAEINFLESVSSVAAIALKNASLYQMMEREALLDGLTGVYNRKTFNKKLEEQFQNQVSQITLVLLNMDDFSLYNELYGSEEGDRVLKDFADMLTQVFGGTGIVARYGGKEFAVLLPYGDPLTAKAMTEQVQQMLEHYIANSRERLKKFLTFSAGICSYPAYAANANELLSYANMTVFKIKQQGKNRVELYSDLDVTTDKKEDGIQELTSTIFALTAAIDAKDHYTFNHSRCVSTYAAALAEHTGATPELVEIIRQAGLLHDIGKIGIPDSILTKTGRLDQEEFSIMRQHVERSIEMIRHLPSLDYVIPAVLGHHERFDGKGYPRGIAGEDIPISARYLSIADAFDAMVSKRSYKNKMPLEDALAEIERNLGLQFDPKLGRTFVDLIRSGDIEVINY